LPLITPVLVAIVMLAGAGAGWLGALLGIGGGVFLVPFLSIGLGLPQKVAIATSLMTVIATSSAVSAGTTGKNLINLRLGMLLEVASAAGGLVAAMTLDYLSERQLYIAFSVVTAAIAVIMLSRLDRRNVLDPRTDPGVLGGRFIDETGHEIVYRVKRLPVALGSSFLAGNVSGILGIGGGILKVPALNSWCGVPMRAAAATSSLMIGVTAVSSVPVYYASGYISPPLAAAAVLCVLVGSSAGLRLGGRVRARWLKLLMAGVLLTVSLIYVFTTP
jgi:uncharacterized membrane protein YfcA